jgi:hypothetical protein
VTEEHFAKAVQNPVYAMQNSGQAVQKAVQPQAPLRPEH